MKLFGRDMTRRDLMGYVGHSSQVFGVQRYTLREGSAEGVEAIEVATGGGLRFQVLPGRGMDLGWMEYRGVPLAFIGKGGIVHSHQYDPRGAGWLKSFAGGFLVTCGLIQAGIPETDDGEDLGLHGRVSHLPAEEVQAATEWDGDESSIRVCGKVREAQLHGENLVLERKISAPAGGKTFTISDTVTNEGFTSTPFMLLYHLNFGFPLIDPDTRLLAPVQNTRPWDGTPEAAGSQDRWAEVEPPTPGREDVAFFHELRADPDGNTCVAVVNRTLGLGVRIGYNIKALPYLTHAKIMKPQDYFLVLEPGNCTIEGRTRLREQGMLAHLDPGAQAQFTVDASVIDGADEIQAVEKEVSRLC